MKKLPRNKVTGKGPISPDSGFISDSVADQLSDYLRQYVGVAMPQASSESGVLLNRDRVFLTQSFMELSGFDLYDEIEQDPQVASVMQQRKIDISTLPWYLKPASESKRDKEIADFVTKALKGGGLAQSTFDMMDCVGKGFSVTEVIWGLSTAGKIVPTSFVNRPQRRFQFDAMTKAPKLRKLTNPFFGDPLPEKKFIVHRNSSKYGNPFGDPLDSKIYWMWLFKRNVTRFWLQYSETTAAPIPIVKHRKGASDVLKKEAMKIAKMIRNGSYGHIPDDMEVLYAEMRNIASTADAYDMFITMCDAAITKCVLGQTLTTEADSKGKGTLALGKVHQSTKSDLLEFDAKSLAATLNGSLVRWIVDYNYSVKEYPELVFGAEDKGDVKGTAEIIKLISEAGFQVDSTYVEEVTGVRLSKTNPLKPEPAPPGEAAPGEKTPNDKNIKPQDKPTKEKNEKV